MSARHAILAATAALLAGCAAPAAVTTEVCTVAAEARALPRVCPPLPILPLGATAQERRAHLATLVRMYAECAGGEV